MSLLRLKTDVAFGGAVTFHMVGYRPQRYFTVMSELADALPTIIKRTEAGGIAFPSGAIGGDIAMFLACVGHTIEITFNLDDDESPSDLLAFRDWWVKVLPKTDIGGAFRTFNGIMSPAVVEAWYAAYENTRDVQPRAAVELRPEAVAQAEADTDFSNGVQAS